MFVSVALPAGQDTVCPGMPTTSAEWHHVLDGGLAVGRISVITDLEIHFSAAVMATVAVPLSQSLTRDSGIEFDPELFGASPVHSGVD